MTTPKNGTCEVCDIVNVPVTVHYGNMAFCAGCWEKEEITQAENKSIDMQNKRVDEMNNAINEAKNLTIIKASEIDNSINVRTDLFNAETVAIVNIKKAIDSDESITNKPYALAEFLKNRFMQSQTIVFELNQKLVEEGNKQKAIQVYLNNLANQLRVEEREKLKISDINYQPGQVKQPKVKTIKTIGTSKKASKADIKAAAIKLGIAEYTLYGFINLNGGDLNKAVAQITKSIEDAKGIQ